MRTQTSEIDYVSCINCEMHALCHPFELAGKSVDLIEGILQRRKLVKKGEVLFSRGEAFKLFQSISAGAFKLVVPDDQGRVAGFCFSGELLDAGGLYAGVHCYDAIALEDSYICTISKESAEDIGHQIPDFQGRLFEMMSEQLYHATRLMTLLTGRRKADERLAAFLLGISLRFREHGYSSDQFHLCMSRDDIASYLGLAKCTVSRTLSRFHRQEMIAASGKYFEIVDIEKLIKCASLPGSEWTQITPVQKP